MRRLITLGSPLASANLFLSTDGASFEQWVRERTLPTHPPTPDAGAIYFEPRKCLADALECDRYLNHAAMFAVTDWVNIYSPQDLLAGPVTWFGPGVRNVRLADTPRRWFARGVTWGPPLAHTDYWRFWPAPNNDPSGALTELRRALDIPADPHRLSHRHLFR